LNEIDDTSQPIKKKKIKLRRITKKATSNEPISARPDITYRPDVTPSPVTASPANWFDSSEEESTIDFDSSVFNVPGKSLFDSLYDISAKSGSIDPAHTDVSFMTLMDVSEAYQFSIPYLGDFLVQIGCRPPIDVDINLGDLLTGEQLYSLLEAINTLDPVETSLDYDCTSARDVAYDLGISDKAVMKICDREGINLPFGIDSVIHNSCVDKIMQVYANDEYDDSSDNNSGDNIDAIDIDADLQ
jgi:hypothetical protein